MNSRLVKVLSEGVKLISVPVRPPDSPTSASGASGSPPLKRIENSLPSRQMRMSRVSESAFTTETPTPCKPPETLYEFWSNLPPACRWVMITSAAETPSSSWIATGMPRPLSVTVTEPSPFSVTSMRSQWPASDSSMALSTTS